MLSLLFNQRTEKIVILVFLLLLMMLMMFFRIWYMVFFINTKAMSQNSRGREKEKPHTCVQFNAQRNRIFINYQNRLVLQRYLKNKCRYIFVVIAVLAQTNAYTTHTYTLSATARRRIIIFIYAFISDVPAKFAQDPEISDTKKKKNENLR